MRRMAMVAAGRPLARVLGAVRWRRRRRRRARPASRRAARLGAEEGTAVARPGDHRRGRAEDRRGRQREDPAALRRRAGSGHPQVRDAGRQRAGAGTATRPQLAWKFIVLDTDGVNALAAPGGYVHITRGALSLMSNEAELAGVLGHEIIHVTEKHTIRAIQKGKAIQMGANETMANSPAIFNKLVDKATERRHGRLRPRRRTRGRREGHRRRQRRPATTRKASARS